MKTLKDCCGVCEWVRVGEVTLEMLLVIYRKDRESEIKHYNILTMFANVYPVIYFDIFGDSFGPGMTALHAS